MSNKFDFDLASDPVCGELVNVDTPHRVEYGGKDLYFCSESCLNQFVADPAAYEGEGTIMLPPGQLKARLEAIRTAKSAAPTAPAPAAAAPAVPAPAAVGAPPAAAPAVTPRQPPPAAAAPATTPQPPPPAAVPARQPAPAAAAAPMPPRQPTPAAASVPPPRQPSAAAARPAGAHDDGADGGSDATLTGFKFPRGGKPVVPPSGVLGWLRAHVMEWVEQRHVDKVCRQMLASFKRIGAANPGAERTDLYRKLVIDRLDCTTAVADRVLTQTHDSFASWPKDRPINLRDVIHYISVAEFLSRRDRPDGMYSDVEKLVSERIPANL